jgi:hypothetical protein
MFSDHLRKPWDGIKWFYAVFLSVLWLAGAAAVIAVGMHRGDPTGEIIAVTAGMAVFGVKMGLFLEVGLYVLSPIDLD